MNEKRSQSARYAETGGAPFGCRGSRGGIARTLPRMRAPRVLCCHLSSRLPDGSPAYMPRLPRYDAAHSRERVMNYKETVFLPRTEFPMRGGLPKKEPEILAGWKQIDIYRKLRETRKDAELFVLHDGPPYANGQLHIGHALNKILKDVINRSQSMLGKNANYVPGWDCHGLPIEWKIEEQYRKKGKDKEHHDKDDPWPEPRPETAPARTQGEPLH